ncbi:MAG: purine-nucleoside phosphorylase [Gemmatimonadota bacterium]
MRGLALSVEAIRRSAAAARERTDRVPSVGIILGTGLAALAEQVRPDATIPYEEIPDFPLSTVETHTGRLILGEIEGAGVAVMQGRVHRYEGYSMAEVAYPVRVLRELGAETLIVSNVSGGLNPLWAPGDLVLLSDHINLLGDNPLIGPNLDELGPRFPDMSEPYDAGLRAIAREEALRLGLFLREGVYVAVAGPNLETAAEYRMLRSIGADLVGMSTVPEVIAARHAGMRVLGLSIVTDTCLPDALEPVDIQAIIETAGRAEPRLTELVRAVVSRL